jgi:predicted MPP superfamily phosphohydrolase
MFTSPAFWIIIGSLLVVLFFLIRQGLREAKHFVLSKQSLPLPNCPETLAGLKILHLSDLHLYPGAKLSEIILSLTEQAEPEVIFITGDLLLRGGRGKGLVEATTLLQALAARRPTYLVLGNEDFYEGQPQPEEAWEKTGAILLVNQAVSLPRRGKNFWMVGVDDPHEGEPDLAEALSDVPAGEPALLLAHSPVIIRQPGIARFAVVFAGHTHGGQICLPGGKALHIHTRLPLRFARGLHKLPNSNTLLVVSRGVGVTRLALRINCPPEITLWTVTGESKQ